MRKVHTLPNRRKEFPNQRKGVFDMNQSILPHAHDIPSHMDSIGAALTHTE